MLNQKKDTHYQVTHCELLAKDISRIILHAPENQGISYLAGQYIKILHPDQSISPMSIACAPHDMAKIELHLHHPPENKQAAALLHLIKSEKQLAVRGPYGSCTAEKIDLNTPIIFMAACTGFAPIKAILETLLTFKQIPEIHFYWAGNTSEELYMQSLADEWVKNIKQFHFIPVIAQPALPIILQTFSDLSLYQVYVVDMEDAVYQALSAFMKRGLIKERFYSDVLDYVPS